MGEGKLAVKSEQFSITEEMLHFLVQHRTEYKGLTLAAAARRYTDDIEATFEKMRPFLPEQADSIVDVGGGLGGMAARLLRHYGTDAGVIVYEREGDAGSKIGWHDSAAEFGAYNSHHLTSLFLETNGGHAHTAGVQLAGDDPFPPGPHQLVVSLLSMGFHYPVETYLQEIYDSLAPGGVLIFDARHGTSLEACREMFKQNPLALNKAEKYTLVAFCK